MVVESISANVEGLAEGGEVKKPPTCNRSALFVQRLKIYSDVQESSFSPNQS
jgi:hypothetical protein